MGNTCSGCGDQKSQKENEIRNMERKQSTKKKTRKVYTQIEAHQYNKGNNQDYIEPNDDLTHNDYDSCSSSQLSDKAKSILNDIINDEQSQPFQTQQYKLEIPKVRDIPLNQFTVDDVCGTILKWIYNDINYNSQLEKTKTIFATHELYGQKLKYLSSSDVKSIIKDEMLTFMTSHTLDIIFNRFDEMKDDIISKHIDEIATDLYNFPIQKLIHTIHNEQINGHKIINILQMETNTIINTITGWNQQETEQIKLLFFRHLVLSESVFLDNMNNIKHNKESTLKVVINKMKQIINEFDIELIQYNIKNNKCIQNFSDKIINMVDDLMTDIIDKDNVSVQDIYEMISNMFICNKPDLCGWVCCNCNNNNFAKYINGKMNYDLSICSLCGIKQNDSIVLKIRNHDTFIMAITDTNKIYSGDVDIKEKDEIDAMMQKVIKYSKIDLFCTSINNNINGRCPSIWRLGRQLIQYKRWLNVVYKKTDGNDDIQNTIKVNMNNISKDVYKKTFIKNAQSINTIQQNAENMQLLIKMFDNNIGEISDIKTFLEMSRKTFAKYLKKHAKINLPQGGKLCIKIKNALKHQAQCQEFGEFLSNLNMELVDSDYHHILKSHIHNGSKMDVKNVFRFFNIVIHSDDIPTEIEKCKSLNIPCRSFKRRDNKAIERMEHKNDNNIASDDKNIWTLTQYYMQTELDVIHSYLCHSKWKRMVKQYTSPFHNDVIDEKEFIMINVDDELENKDEDSKIQNKKKYVSNAESIEKYGFGVVHEHHILGPVMDSIYDEMIYNKQHSLGEIAFHHLLVKAINKQKIAAKDYNKELISKYFRKEYNILRNDLIGVRHIIAIVIYTDISELCTIFRTTYRKINDEKEQDVTKRHIEYYFWARALFESVEFFGEKMTTKSKVYHGLNSKKMNFDKFTAYFNQPVSTTKSFQAAQQFSHESGIILTLKSGAKYLNDPSKIPKYLSVAWLSTYPNEDERLFYGAHVVFRIFDIHNAVKNKWTSHEMELLAFNNFQNMLQNQMVKWENKQNILKVLLSLINHHQQKISSDEQIISEYGKQLFNHFCDNITWICVQNFHSLPKELKTLLLNENEQSIVPILKLFSNLKEIIFNDIDIESMTNYCDNYVQMVLECIEDTNKIHSKHFKQISFKSKQHSEGKQNSILKTLQITNMKELKTFQWNMKYEYEIENTHNLTFINEQIDIADCISELKQKERELEIQQENVKKEMEIRMEQQEIQVERANMERERMEKQRAETELQLENLQLQITDQSSLREQQIEQHEKIENELKQREKKLHNQLELLQQRNKDLEKKELKKSDLSNEALWIENKFIYEQYIPSTDKQTQTVKTWKILDNNQQLTHRFYELEDENKEKSQQILSSNTEKNSLLIDINELKDTITNLQTANEEQSSQIESLKMENESLILQLKKQMNKSKHKEKHIGLKMIKTKSVNVDQRAKPPAFNSLSKTSKSASYNSHLSVDTIESTDYYEYMSDESNGKHVRVDELKNKYEQNQKTSNAKMKYSPKIKVIKPDQVWIKKEKMKLHRKRSKNKSIVQLELRKMVSIATEEIFANESKSESSDETENIHQRHGSLKDIANKRLVSSNSFTQPEEPLKEEDESQED